jgi:hypothetical protein
MATIPTKRFVYIPVNHKLKVTDKTGLEFQPVSILEIVDRRICALARWIQTKGKFHYVRFRDGHYAWVPSWGTRWYDEVVRAA